MDWNIDIEEIRDLVDEEVSRAADAAYSEDGVPLYDSIVLTLKDADNLLRFIGDAVRGVQARLFDVARVESPVSVRFHLPDLDPTYADPARAELRRFVVMSVCAGIFRQVRPALVQEYSDRSQAALTAAVTMLKTRKSPADIW